MAPLRNRLLRWWPVILALVLLWLGVICYLHRADRAERLEHLWSLTESYQYIFPSPGDEGVLGISIDPRTLRHIGPDGGTTWEFPLRMQYLLPLPVIEDNLIYFRESDVWYQPTRFCILDEDGGSVSDIEVAAMEPAFELTPDGDRLLVSYFADKRTDGKGGVACLDLQLNPVWTFATDESASLAPSAGSDGRILFTLYEPGGKLLCCLDRDGNLQWTCKTTVGSLVTITMLPDDACLLATNQGLLCIGPDGGLRWRALEQLQVETPLQVPDGRLITTTSDGYVHCLDPDGNALWKTALTRSNRRYKFHDCSLFLLSDGRLAGFENLTFSKSIVETLADGNRPSYIKDFTIETVFIIETQSGRVLKKYCLPQVLDEQMDGFGWVEVDANDVIYLRDMNVYNPRLHCLRIPE